MIVPDAGHSALEPGIRAALVNATEKLPPVDAATTISSRRAFPGKT